MIEGLDLQKTGNFALLRERGSKGNEKLDVQGAIFLKGSICSDIAANKCIACAFARKKLKIALKQIQSMLTYFPFSEKLFFAFANIFKYLKPCGGPSALVGFLNSGRRLAK